MCFGYILVNFVLIFVEYYDLGIYYMEIFNGGIYKVLFLDWVNEEFVCLFMFWCVWNRFKYRLNEKCYNVWFL